MRTAKETTEPNSDEGETSKAKPQGPKPSDYMRARRPYLFSDSKIRRKPQLSRPVFEYLLKTITSRKQEVDFEYFCRRLAENEVCPNLLPQTGPTGGGDSKVDSETYPVAHEISMRWYEGQCSGEAAKESWAFAFSAKEHWRPKVNDDVRKIAGTKRGYKLVYFITNQAVKDKVRAEVETSLRKKYHLKVRILDRSWILKCVFEHDRIDLAIECLHLDTSDRVKKVTGPHDTRRQRALEQVEREIRDPNRYRGVEYQLAEDCLRAALIARGMELPRVEIDGRFDRAQNIATKLGHVQQQLRFLYARAWTAFWWFDDFDELIALYPRVEQLALTSDESNDIELLANLWSLLISSVRIHGVDAVKAKLEERTATLRAKLETLAKDHDRQNNALWARTQLVFGDLHLATMDGKETSAFLVLLKEILLKAENSISYPIEAVANVVEELGDAFGSSTEYDDLFETVTTMMRNRTSDGEAGRLLLARGHQKLRGGRRYDAIRFYGRAQQLVAKREYRLELVAALMGGSMAYEAVGLLWAARANALSAANQAMSEYYEHGEILPQLLTCLRKLAWLELQLGRVPHVFQWIELTSLIAQHLAISGKRKDEYLEESLTQDAILGILFLKADLPTLATLKHLPDVLGELGLERSRMALLYALGYENELREQGYVPESEDEPAVREFFQKWLSQPASEDIPTAPELFSGSQVILHSPVLGCDIRAVAPPSDLHSISVAEHVLAALEALLATSLQDVFPHAQEFTIEIVPSPDVKGDPQCQFEEGSFGQKVSIKHAEGDAFAPLSGQQLQELTVGITARIAFINNLEKYGERVFGRESGFGRAINFSEPLVPLTNIFGGRPKLRITDWQPPAAGKDFPLRRAKPWLDGLQPEPSQKTTRMYDEGARGEGDPPKELVNLEDHKHTQRRVSSLINVPLWDKAGWSGMLYAYGADLSEPPILAMLFRDAEFARSIFTGWRSRLGEIDKEEQLHISIVTGIDVEYPFSYATVIGSNPTFEASGGRSLFLSMSRINRMNPSDSRNLDTFLSRFERLGRYFLMPAHMTGDNEQPKLMMDLWIGKNQLRVVPAWKIGRNDPDAVALGPKDKPIIPADVPNAPVIELLKWKESRLHQTNQIR